MDNKNRFQHGFTIIEVIVTMTLVFIIAGGIIINLLNAKQSSTMSTQLSLLISDMKYTQIKAMTGDTEGRGTISTYGIHFNTTNYVMFHGTYNAGDSSNYVITFDPAITVSAVTFPNREIIFNNGDGAIVGYTGTTNTVTIKDGTNNKTKTVTFNQYGAISQIN